MLSDPFLPPATALALKERAIAAADKVGMMAVQYVPKVLLALIVLFAGLRAINIGLRLMDRALHNQRIDRSLAGFLRSLLSVFLKILLIVTVASMLGIQMASFVALLGAAGLAVGLSLQGSLSNIAGGVLILFFKPFRVGESIEAQLQKGTVERIELFTTTVRGEDGRMIIMPNGPLSNAIIINHSRKA